MKRKHRPGDEKNREKRPHQGLTTGRDKDFTLALSSVLDGDFLTWLKSADAQSQDLNETGSVKSFKLGGKKYVAIISTNKAYDNTRVDYKAWHGGVLKAYKTIHNMIKDRYYPEPPPYELKFPKILFHTHDHGKEVTITEFIDNLATFEKINNHSIKVPSSHINFINDFIDDWHNVIFRHASNNELTSDSYLNLQYGYLNKYRDFTVKMPYGNLLVSDDFSANDAMGSAGSENLSNMSYSLDSKEKPIIYVMDGLRAMALLD